MGLVLGAAGHCRGSPPRCTHTVWVAAARNPGFLRCVPNAFKGFVILNLRGRGSGRGRGRDRGD